MCLILEVRFRGDPLAVKRSGSCWKLKVETLEQRQWRLSVDVCSQMKTELLTGVDC